MAESHREEIAKLEALYAGNPGGRVFVHLAEAYRKAGEHERARRILDEGLARHSDSASGFVVLGRVLADMQITDEAEVAFRRVLELDGGNLVALRWLGDLARQSGRTDEAITHYRDLLARNPSNEEVRDLVEIVEREALTGSPRTALDEEPAWQEPEPAEQVPETPEEPLTPLSAAPGRTGDEEPADIEFGLVEIESITAEAGSAAEPEAAAEPAEAAEEPPEWAAAPTAEPVPVQDAGEPQFAEEAASDEIHLELAAAEPEPETMVEPFGGDDSLLVESTTDDGFEELAGLARNDEADDLEIHLLDPAYSGDEDSADDYADDDFIADLVTAGEEPREEDALDAGELDVLGASPLTLQDAEVDERADEPAPEPAEPWDDGTEPFGAVEEAAAFGSFAEEPAPDAPAAPAAQTGWEGGVEAEVWIEAEPAETGAVEPPPLKPHGDELAEAALGGAGQEPGPVTETMAELYRAQGFHDRAAEVYRALLRQRPFDLRLSEKLSEAEADAAEARAEEAASRVAPEIEDEASGEVWLRGVGAPWDAGSADNVESATPYAWTEESEEQPLAGQPISSYLKDLVSWKTASQRWAETPPPAPPAQPAQQAPWSPDDEPWAAAPVDETWGTTDSAETVNPWGSAAEEQAASPWGEPAGGSAAADDAQDPWGVRPGPEPAEPAAEPADPWLQGSTEAPADPLVAGSDASASAQEASQPWTPLDAESAAASPSAAQPGEEEESESDDEDLEMFRSWLQSLKK